MNRKALLFIIIVSYYFFMGCNSSAKKSKEEYDERIEKLVLQENKIGIDYTFKARSPKNESVDDYIITYLGSIQTINGDSLRFLKEIHFSGSSELTQHGSCVVTIYNSNQEKLGFYYVGGATDGPTRIERDKLIFDSREDCNLTTSISFRDSIPNQIFVRCTEKGGDLFTFGNQ
ncbi:hypothetical protein [Xanthocytophaga agilis]|uniref:Lipoprotein n=1 Tax=Xanthocytophaga agilis TaxID=3048010 RepID=A0AAE3UBX7_9BACT|nr:hypothetical protein [Xanthocytophaga agilis]MDJ1500308.1 hypothetical protein [Xanthocytophaga agilis]